MLAVEERLRLVRYTCMGLFVFLYAMLHAEPDAILSFFELAVLFSAGPGLALIIAGSALKFAGRREPPVHWKWYLSGGPCVLIALVFVFLIFTDLH